MSKLLVYEYWGNNFIMLVVDKKRRLVFDHSHRNYNIKFHEILIS